MFKYGTAAIIGRPNTGKSTLLNAIMNQKVTITSPLPQTTRKNVRVRYQDERGAIDFIDTPGMMGKIEDLVGKKANRETPKSLSGADVVICLMDISRPKNEEDNKVIGLVRKSTAPKILVYNKIDKAKVSQGYLPEYNFLEEEFDHVVGISAIRNKNVRELIKIIFELLPEGQPQEDQSEFKIPVSSSDYISEIIREKLFLFLRREVPYTTTVVVDSIEDKKAIIVVKADILTNAERYKKMIIGKNGQKIKQIGSNARKELELMSGRKIYLDLTVKIDKHWQERV
ncbi:MAG TPA: GTPase Era [Candidatus Woesebacteria bacterium]|nr:GTPase Era [Candidatus Woesebacteria bacterium]HRT40371.1 GTPase Era [Candidatus Woesebacteria bacterium]